MFRKLYKYIVVICSVMMLVSCAEDDFVSTEPEFHDAVLIKCAVADYITEESDMTRGLTRGMSYDDNMITKLDLLIFETQGTNANTLLKHLEATVNETGSYTWDITGKMPKDYLKNKNVAIYLIANYYPSDHGGTEITTFNPTNANTFFIVSSTDPFPPGDMLNHGIVMSQVMEGTKNYTTDGNNNLIMNFNNLERVMAKAEFFVADENTQNKLQASETTVTGLTNIGTVTINYTDNKGTEISKSLNIYQPETKYTEANDNSFIKYTITPEKNFTPNKLSFYAARYGTDGGKFDIKIKRGDVTKEITTSFIPERYNNKIPVDISGYEQESGQSGKYLNGNLDSFKDSETAELGFNVSNNNDGNYVLSFKSASKRGDAKAKFEIKNGNSETSLYTETFDLPNTSDWQKYITKIGSKSTGLSSGDYKIVITFYSSSGQFTANIKDIELRKEDDSDSMDGDKDAGTEISFAEFDVNEISGSTDPIEIYFYVYNLDKERKIYLGDVAITGMVTTTSEIKEYKVQNYTNGYTLFNIGDVDKSTTTEIKNKADVSYTNTGFTDLSTHPQGLKDAENNSFAFYFYPNYWFDLDKATKMHEQEPIIYGRQTHVLVKANYEDKDYFYKIPINYRLPKYSDAHQSQDHFNSKIDEMCVEINKGEGNYDESELVNSFYNYVYSYLFYTYESGEEYKTKLREGCQAVFDVAKASGADKAKEAIKTSAIYEVFKEKNITEAERLCRIQRNHHYKITVNIDKPGGETDDEAVYIMPAPYGDITARPEF